MNTSYPKNACVEAKNSDRNFCTILLLECVLAARAFGFFKLERKKPDGLDAAKCVSKRPVLITPGLTIASFIFDMYSVWIFHWKKFLIEDLCGMVMSSERRRSTCEWTFVGRNKFRRINLGAKRPVTGRSTRDNFDNSLSKCVLTNHMNQGNTGNPRHLQFSEFSFSADKNWAAQKVTIAVFRSFRNLEGKLWSLNCWFARVNNEICSQCLRSSDRNICIFLFRTSSVDFEVLNIIMQPYLKLRTSLNFPGAISLLHYVTESLSTNCFGNYFLQILLLCRCLIKIRVNENWTTMKATHITFVKLWSLI